jgi:hypothetical protein
MRTRPWIWWAIGLLLLAAIAATVLRWAEPPKGKRFETGGGTATEASQPPAPDASTPVPPAAVENDAGQALASAWARLADLTPAERAALLRRLSRQFDELPIGEVEDAILAELESGRDAETGLDFITGEDGLTSAPTWRVYLLDLLGRINPRTAAEHARSAIFPATASADEWAVSMRNVWQSYPPRARTRAQAETGQLLGQMLARPEWRAAPSPGLLEALDFVAHTTEPARHLADLARWLDERSAPPAEEAVQIAVERTMVWRGDEVLPVLAPAAGTAGEGGIAVRALAMARADLRRPAQRQAVADYLRRLPPASDEAAAFFGAFPLHSFSVAPGLSGLPRLPQAGDLRTADEAALVVLGGWSADPRLAAHTSRLTGLAQKLREWTENR